MDNIKKKAIKDILRFTGFCMILQFASCVGLYLEQFLRSSWLYFCVMHLIMASKMCDFSFYLILRLHSLCGN